ncbi:MAG TPA: uracil-DNA glycosylase family protein [Planctomycetota bacterium]|nr:uracil-DNA glycosylase family protein [Planctomycetota bacterium]
MIRHHLSTIAVILLLAAAPAVRAQDDPKPIDPYKIRTAALDGKWSATVKGSDGSRTIEVQVDDGNTQINLGGQVFKFKRTDGKDPTTKARTSTLEATASSADMLHSDGTDVKSTLTLSIVSPTEISGTYTITRGKKVEKGTIEITRPKMPTPKPWTPPTVEDMNLAAFDPGPPKKLAEHIASFPGDKLGLYTHDNAWVNFDPVWYRGRAGTGKAKVLVLASDPGPDEAVVRRTLVGDAGKRVQGFMDKIGLTEGYVMANAHPYAIYPGRAMSDGFTILDDPTLKDWRNKYYDLLVGGAKNDIEAIIAFGAQAQKALDLWEGKPDVPVFKLQHPSAEDTPEKLSAWNKAVTALRKIVTPDENAPKKPNYGDKLTKDDYGSIPRADLPFGTARWVGQKDRPNFASRPGGDVFRNEINVTVPSRADVGGGFLNMVGGNVTSAIAKVRGGANAADIAKAASRTSGATGALLKARISESADEKDAAEER